MKKYALFGTGLLLLLMGTLLEAGTPLWTFTPLTATSVTVPLRSSTTVQYLVTNQSSRQHTLVLQPMRGVTQITTGNGVCGNPFVLPTKGSSCVLSISITGGRLVRNFRDGPIVCQQGSTNQCYRPSQADVLHVTLGPKLKQAIIEVSGSPLALTTNGSSGDLTITNTSTTVTATNIASNFTGTALDGNVTETGNTCASLAPGGSCTLTFTPGSNPVGQTGFPIQGDNTNAVTGAILVSSAGNSALSSSVLTLALSVNNTALNPALTGTPRIITLTNQGNAATTNFSITYPAWPNGTSTMTTCGGSLAASASCTITITPGASATSNCNTGTAPTNDIIEVSATNSTPVSIEVPVLSYGCQYQSGFVYAIDDTTLNTISISGKAATSSNQGLPSGIIWSSNGTEGQVDYTPFPGISETSTTPCVGAYDGACNSEQVWDYYTPISTYPLSYYAVGLCALPIDGYSDWYLPAICELGKSSTNENSNCTPGTQNMTQNLRFLLSTAHCNLGSACFLSSFYYSSTEFAASLKNVWYQATVAEPVQGLSNKSHPIYVRCSRVLTQP